MELDGEVIDLARVHFPDVSGGAFDDPRATVYIMDGTQYVIDTKLQFDVIIIDSTDAVGRGKPLFTKEFYKDCRRTLRPGGIMVVQSGAPFFQRRELDLVCARLAQHFPAVRPFLAPVPTYASGMLALVAAGQSCDALRPPCKILRERFASLRGDTRYYTPEVHRAAFTLPPTFVRGGPGKLKRLSSSTTRTHRSWL